MRAMLRSKIHRARVTETNIDYEGSITIDKKLMQEADILPGEQVHVVNLNNASRLVTYAIEGKSGSGMICLNGAASRLAIKSDIVIIIAYGYFSEEEARTIKPRLVHVDEKNSIVKVN